MRKLLLIGSAALILAVVTIQWLAWLPVAARANTAGVSLDEPAPWSSDEPGRVNGVEMGGAADRAGLRKGDRVQAINGIPTVAYHELHRLVDHSRAGDSLEYAVLRGTQTRTVPLRLESRLGRIWLSLLRNAFAAGIFFGVGVFVYWKRPADRRARTFFLMCLPFALMFSLFNVLAVSQGDFLSRSAIAQGSLMVASLFFFLFPPLLHFTLIFPKPRPLVEKYPGVLGWIYALPALIAFWIVAIALSIGSQEMNPGLGLGIVGAIGEFQGRRLVTVALVIGLLAPAVLLFWKCVRSVWREGWKSLLLSRPVLLISTLFFTPLLFGLCLPPLSAAFGSLIFLRGWIAAGVVLLLELIAALLAQLIIPVAACVSLFRNRRDADIAGKHQLRWPYRGTVTAVAGSLLSSVTLLVLQSRGPVSSGGWWLTTLFLLLIPISFAFAITKYRLMEKFPTAGTPAAGATAG